MPSRLHIRQFTHAKTDDCSMRISIITATYNSAATIRDTALSVKAQSYESVEHIIIDGGSTDGTLDILKEYQHIGRISSEPDRGMYDAMNKGISMANGDVIGILNSDDFYAGPKVLEKVSEAFASTEIDAVYGDLDYVDATDANRLVRSWRSGRYVQDAFKWGWMPPHPTFFVRKEIYERYGGFNLNMGTAADYELMLRFIHRQRIRMAYLPEVLVKMRSGGASNASLTARLKANQNDHKAWKENDLEPYWFTLYLKPLRKISQFLVR